MGGVVVALAVFDDALDWDELIAWFPLPAPTPVYLHNGSLTWSASRRPICTLISATVFRMVEVMMNGGDIQEFFAYFGLKSNIPFLFILNFR